MVATAPLVLTWFRLRPWIADAAGGGLEDLVAPGLATTAVLWLTALLGNATAVGYRPAPTHLAVDRVWHVTSNRVLRSAPMGSVVNLDLHFNPWRKRLRRADRPWLRPRRAVFVFLCVPDRVDRRDNVAFAARPVLLELEPLGPIDGAFVRDNALAVTGVLPARVVGSSPLKAAKGRR
jgi:hypothetical protein